MTQDDDWSALFCRKMELKTRLITHSKMWRQWRSIPKTLVYVRRKNNKNAMCHIQDSFFIHNYTYDKDKKQLIRRKCFSRLFSPSRSPHQNYKRFLIAKNNLDIMELRVESRNSGEGLRGDWSVFWWVLLTIFYEGFKGSWEKQNNWDKSKRVVVCLWLKYLKATTSFSILSLINISAFTSTHSRT